ncbi:DNA polymerase III subunit alpha [Paraeggerthella hongkongensis]|uniref:DNA polymerase III subunit alpha n=1 Tax=Paraeggerthella hongkongensis TaxID=230658 RepID=A0A3N0B856_9ACTN|nr:DNA polymerase III subunit alpha [Paraeggerthella hongkongensis]RNL43081.1 DNA polymerase III subunit alpha [Paraeggerthella hongkongensis]
MAFVHLHNHTEYSLLDGATHVKDMVRRAAELGMPAVAISDHGVMSGVPELCDACDAVEKETGIRVKPIYGCEVYFTTDEELRKDVKPKLYHLLLLSKTNEGYHNLLRLVSESHVDNFYYKPRTTFSMLQKYGKGIIGSSACIAGIIPKLLDNNQFDEALEWAHKLASCFDPGDFYIELQNQGIMTDAGLTQTQLNHQLTKLAQAAGLKTIATNDFHYLTREDARAQDIMLCIGTGSAMNDANRMRFENDQFYMKTEEEMREALKDFPEACDNTVELAAKCDVVLERDSVLPRFPLPEGETEDSWFRTRVQEGLIKRYGDPVPQEAQERADYEMSIIIQQGFPAYFLIVQEYIEWARSQGIGVGPGRGSAAGAIVAYAMGITDLDPLSNGLLFERFLSPERVEMPDIDVDFEDERRQEVIEHIKEVYGEDHVAGVITFGKLQAKNAVRDAARVLDYPYSTGDKITKMIGDELGITIDKALETNLDLKKAYETEEDVKAVIDAAKSIEGHVRGEGVHACATIICRDPMSEHVPMKRDTKGGGIITQYDGHYTPDLGLLKMDFLGLRTLGVLSRACRNIEARFGTKVIPEEIPIDDERAFVLMQSGNMDGLFQVEGALYVGLFARLPPKRFSDIVASIALNRPGPLESGMVDDYVKVASGKTQIHYYDERLRSILEETYGTMVYQEQIMQISMAMSGFSAGKADKLRKAMGKKKLDVMRGLQEDWNNGAVENGYSLEIAKQIWEDAEKFAKYAFNKSHSAAYAILVMRTAYLKAHYPNDFMAAVLSSYMGNTDRLIRYISSCNHNGTPVLPPDINSSNAEFTPVEEGIRFGLVGVRGVGRNVADEIIAEREANGPYTSLHDFVNRLDAKCYNRKTLEALIKGGAFDSTGYTRKQLMYFVDETPLLESASKRQKDRERGQVSMFDLFGDDPDSGFEEEVPAPDGVEWPKRQLLTFEKEIMKIYVSDHPLRPYENYIARMTKFQLGDLAERTKEIKSAVFIGMISSVVTKLTKRGTKMATFSLEDTTGHVECICFKYDENAEAIQEDAIVKVKGKFEHSDRGNQIMAFEMEALELSEDDARPSHLELRVPMADFDQSKSLRLNRILKSYPGRDGVVLFVQQNDGHKFRAELPITVDSNSPIMKSELQELFGAQVWRAS